MSTPSNYEQLTFEFINLLRADPGGEYDRLVGVQSDIDFNVSYFGVDLAVLAAQFDALSVAPPLAWNSALATSADTHSGLMIQFDQQSHNLPGEPSLGDRVKNAGYTGWSNVGENIFLSPSNALLSHAGFSIDWGYDDDDWTTDAAGNQVLKSDWQKIGDGIQDGAGHRVNMTSATFTEIGIGVIEETDPDTNAGPYVTTQHFGNRFSYAPQFLGVVIDDLDGDSFYDIGEGLGGVNVRLTGGGQTYYTETWSSGGWQVAVPAGTYTIEFYGGALNNTVTKKATLSDENVKVDAIAETGNQAPVASVPDQSVDPLEWVKLETVLSVTDADGDAITEYELWDSNANYNNWFADGARVDASNGYRTTDLSNIWFQGDPSPGDQTLWVRASDGTDWSNWDAFALATGNQAPVASVPDQSVDPLEWVKLETVLSVSDADGDAITEYELWDSNANYNNWFADGARVDASNGYRTTDLSGVWFQGDPGASDQTLWVRASDGTDWSDWDAFALATGNQAPVASVPDQSVDPLEWVKLETVLSVSDADGDAITEYELWDSNANYNNWFADGARVDASNGYRTTDLSSVWFQGDPGASDQTLWVRASDGTDWSNWDAFALATGNQAPVASVPNLSADPLEWVKLETILSVTDADGDAITEYELWDSSTNYNNWFADGARVDASEGYRTADLSGIWLQGDPSPGDQTLWVRASDGADWSDWDDFMLFTV